MKKINLTPVVLAVMVVITGCTSTTLQKQNERSIGDAADIAKTGTPALKDMLNPASIGSTTNADKLADMQQAQRKGAVSSKASKPWIGTRTIAIQSDEVLPPVFAAQHDINFDDSRSGRVSINVVAERLTKLTGVPVRVKNDVFSGAGMLSSAAKSTTTSSSTSESSGSTVTPTDLNSIEMRWSGSLSGYLDHITGRLGISWSYRDGVVLIERYITETFEIAALKSSQDFSFKMSGSGSGTSGTSGASGSSSSGLDVNESGKIEAVDSLTNTIKSMLSGMAGSSVTLSDGTASLVVTTSKDMMGRIRQVIKQQNASMMRSVQLQFDIYSVINNESNEAGIDINLLMQSLNDGVATALTTPSTLAGSVAGGLSLTMFNTNGIIAKNSSAVLKALASFGTSAQHRPVSLIAMNRQWARKTNLKQTGFLQETTPAPASSAGAGGLPGLKTGTVTTGDTLAVQPAILDNGTIIMKFGVGLTDLLGLFDVTTGKDGTLQKVQTPEVSGTNDQSTVTIKPGESMILTGMSRIRMNTQARSLGEDISPAVGGSKTNSRVREDFIIIVRPILM